MSHRRNKLSLHEREKALPLAHLRSFSCSKQHRRNISNLNTNYVTTDNYISNSVTLPVSIDYNKHTNNLKKLAFRQSEQLAKKKQKGNSKEKQLNGVRKEKQKDTIKATKSNQKKQKSMKRSQQLMKHKNSPIKIITNDGKGGKSNKTRSKQKLQKGQKQKKDSRSKQRLRSSDMGANWCQIIEEYRDRLSLSQIKEIKQYKCIYFLGKITERHKLQPYQQILSAHKQQQQTLNQLNCFTQLKEKDGGATHTQEQTQDEFYKYETGDHLAYRYQIIGSINRGSFGEVIKVYDHKGKEFLAVKIVKKCQELVQQTLEEISILTQIKERDKANLSGVVRIKDFTIFRNHCIVFELLNGNLYELLAANNYNGLGQDIVRIFAVQILNSLNFLQRERVIHCDIKPENIVMKTWGKSGIKLVDFGTSCFEGKQLYQYLQSRYYRAPQIMLRKPYSFPIDMWSFGCLIAELKMGEPIFAGTTNIEQLMYICNSIGYPQPQDGPYSSSFLDQDQFKELQENDFIGQYKRTGALGGTYSDHPLFSKCKYLDHCMKSLKQRLAINTKQSQSSEFLDFLMKILVWQPSKRLRPEQALQHPWIVKGLPKQIKQLYTVFNSCESSVQHRTNKQMMNPNRKKQQKNKQKAKNSPLSEERRTQSKSHNSKFSNGIGKLKNGTAHHKPSGGSFTFR